MTKMSDADEMYDRTIFYDTTNDWLKACHRHECIETIISLDNPRLMILGFECQGCKKIIGIRKVVFKHTVEELEKDIQQVLKVRGGRQLVAREISHLRGTIYIKKEER